ncbi:MAG: hypothetical protein HOW73_28645 [Polyangiaceae bacterium]|nr:hypothetical protein [Polyangiaceae bacterium]
MRAAAGKRQDGSTEAVQLARELDTEDAFGGRASEISGFIRDLSAGRWVSARDGGAWQSQVVAMFAEHVRRLSESHPLPWRMQLGRIASFKALAKWAHRTPVPSPYLEARGKELSGAMTSAAPDRLAGAHALAFIATFELIRAVGAELFRVAATDSAGGLPLALGPGRGGKPIRLATGIFEYLGPVADEVPERALDAFVMASPSDDLLAAALKVFWQTIGRRVVERLAHAPTDVADLCNVVCQQALMGWTLLMRDGLIPTLAAYAGTLTLMPSHKLNAFEPLLEMARLGAVPLGTTAPDKLVVFTRALS